MWVLGTNVLSRGITDCMIAIGAAAALALGASRVSAGEMELAGLLVILMMGVEIFRPMRDLRAVLHQGMVGLSAAQGIYAILDARQEVADGPGPGGGPAGAGHRLREVTFGYPGARGPAHRDLSFSRCTGGAIGVVGQSGCGKTSIVRLLLRFFDPDSGRVTLGGIDLRDMSFAQDPPEHFGRQPGHLPVPRHHRREYPHGPPDASREEVEEAARVANINGFIDTCPDGYDTIIGEKGISFRADSANGSPLPAPYCATRRSWLDEALSAVMPTMRR